MTYEFWTWKTLIGIGVVIMSGAVFLIAGGLTKFAKWVEKW